MKGPVSPEDPGGVPGATPLLVAYVALLWLIPSQLTITALGSVGRPATLLGLVALVWWTLQTMVSLGRATRRPQPVRTSYTFFLCAVLVSYAIAQAKGLPTDEVSPSDSAVLRILSLGGVLLIANDGIRSTTELFWLLRVMATLGGLVAALGLVQFLTGQAVIDQISLPGMAADGELGGIQDRGGFVRASGTAAHPLEYAVVLMTALPLAISLGFYDRERALGRRWWAAAAIAMATTVAVSRSAILGAVVAVLVLLPGLTPRARRTMALAWGILLSLAFVAIPGIIGTIRGMFLSVESDPSALSRTSALSAALDVVGNNPLLGRGLGTFLPKYFILDNQLVLLAIEVGILGLLAFSALFVCAVAQAQVARRRAGTDLEKALLQALTASLCSLFALFAFFDALSFPMAATFFLLAGLAGAAANVTQPSPDSVVASHPDHGGKPPDLDQCGVLTQQTRRYRRSAAITTAPAPGSIPNAAGDPPTGS
jgi:O-antigen ligase